MKHDECTAYTVCHCEYGVWVVGDLADGDEIHGLVKAWYYRGWKLLSRKVARKLDAIVAACKNTSDEQDWLDELGKPNLGEANFSESRKAPEAHPSHQWNGTVLNCCIQCEAFFGQQDAFLPCDPSKLAGKMENCCNCCAEYPRSDLLAGRIYCSKCLKEDKSI